MLDGMIDTQGTVKELRSQGILNDIAQDEAVEAPKEEEAVAVDVVVDNAADLDGEAEAKPVGEAKKAQQLINDEAREYGAVKWSIYSKYLKASSYWTWGHFDRPRYRCAALGRRREIVDQAVGQRLR
ncbi:hypothetical protein FIBSPDRAFT_537529 [Athelia psychrophila]|uniref:Uncharacterized protein n=1 Tax=Athelia psychrophila TaxID=1759441 RepID=A0A166J7V3_9AGAM|nr:hypothetical protein FIBSPDRAFT_537529 [Fibularhizoctonia sp. CBS 109695]